MLILFDVDGTLTATTACDLKCYAATVERVFGIALPSRDWHSYRHVTDSGIISELLEPIRGSGVTAQELSDFEVAFEESLRAEWREDPGAFGEIPGARALLDALRERGCRVALASGGMRRTALFKLSCAGIDGSVYPGAFANDAESREGIALCAIERAGGAEDVVYVGDGLWDARTSAALGMRFVGVTRESCGNRLQSAGATVCVHDFRDLDAFLVALKTATVPEAGRRPAETV